MAYRYTPEQKAQALILLAANRGNIVLTASQTGIGPDQLQKWARTEEALPSPEIGKGMEHAIHYLMGQIPNLVNKYNIAELLGVLLEKWLQYQGIPQNSTQTILAVLATKSEDQLDRMISDIDQGRQLTLNNQQQILDVEREMRNVGLMGLKEKVQMELKTETVPAEVIDLIEYSNSPDKEEDPPDGDSDW